ncbi:MAG: cysteine-rich CWC family protein [Halopseudomonas sp.]
MHQTIDPSLCPLCGQNNACLNVSCGGGPENNCWCNDTAVTFPAELCAKVPEANRRKACICRNCADAHSKALSQ